MARFLYIITVFIVNSLLIVSCLHNDKIPTDTNIIAGLDNYIADPDPNMAVENAKTLTAQANYVRTNRTDGIYCFDEQINKTENKAFAREISGSKEEMAYFENEYYYYYYKDLDTTFSMTYKNVNTFVSPLDTVMERDWTKIEDNVYTKSEHTSKFTITINQRGLIEKEVQVYTESFNQPTITTTFYSYQTQPIVRPIELDQSTERETVKVIVHYDNGSAYQWAVKHLTESGYNLQLNKIESLTNRGSWLYYTDKEMTKLWGDYGSAYGTVAGPTTLWASRQ